MDKKYLLPDLVDLLSSEGNIKKKEAEDFLKLYFNIIDEFLIIDKTVKINNIGTFRLIEAEARASVDVNTGQSFLIKEHFKLSFLPDSKLKDFVNKPFSDFLPVETIDSSSDVQNIEEDYKKEINDSPEIQIEDNLKTPDTKASSLNYIYDEISETGVITDDIDDLPKIEEKANEIKAKKNHINYLKILFFVLLCIVLFLIVFWTVKSNLDAKKESIEKDKILNEYISQSENAQIKEDVVVLKDTVVPKDTLIQNKEIAEIVEYPIYITIMPGVNLMTLSKKYYGHKAFWVYIFMDNRDVIPNPNNITVGKKIKISSPDPQKINSQSDVCLKKAEELQSKILNEYNN